MTPAAAARFEPIDGLIVAARRNGRAALTEPEAKAMLAHAGISVPPERVVQTAREAVRAARAFGFPAVLKIVSPDLPHKSDAGGVRLGLGSAAAVEQAFAAMRAAVLATRPDARIDGVLVQPQLRGGVEVILGATSDPLFGPVMVFGVGGTAVEVLGDVVFRLIPIDEHDARAMLAEIKASPLLDGFRGSAAVSKDAIVRAMLTLSALMARHADAIKEIEINPLLVTPDEAFAIDAMAVVAPAEAL
jgi:acyl-CoA synthetase (NDP forming)